MLFYLSVHLRRGLSNNYAQIHRQWLDLNASRVIKRCVSVRKYSKHVIDEDMAHIRNIGIMAHIDAGKTTTTERMLFYSGFSRHLGNVDDGNTITDYMDQERERGITITSAAVTFHWNKHKINLIDTPGHVDFTIEVERALRVLDGAVAVLDASAGVEAQTLTVWRQADHYNIPRFIFLNKMDKPWSSLDLCLTSIRQKLNAEPALINFIIGEPKALGGVVDVVSMEKIIWDVQKNPHGDVYTVQKMSKSDDKELWDKALELRTSLINQLADHDDVMADIVIAEASLENIKPADIYSALRRTTLNRKLVPVLCGSALKNIGIQQVLDGVTKYLPSPSDCHYDFIQHYDTDLCALAFKIIHDKYRGCLTFLRLYSGSISSVGGLYNVNRDAKEKIARLLQVYANEYHEITGAGPGNIVCVSGLKETITGDTLTTSQKAAHFAMSHTTDDESDRLHGKAVLAGLEVPPPVFFCSIEPPSMAEQKKLDETLECLQKEDPSLQVHTDKETGQTILRGMGELHLDIIKYRIQNEFGIDIYMGPLQIAYKETIESSAVVEETLDRMLDNRKHHVHMILSVRFNVNTRDFNTVKLVQSKDEHFTELHPRQLQAVNKGIKSSLSYGPVLSFPVMDVEVSLHKLEVGRGTSKNMIAACASQCLQKALKQADPVLLEPMMKLQISTNADKLSNVMGDLNKRRSHVENVADLQDIKIVDAVTPLAEMMGYSTELRRITSGMATFTMELSHYEKLSQFEQDKAIERVTGFAPS